MVYRQGSSRVIVCRPAGAGEESRAEQSRRTWGGRPRPTGRWPRQLAIRPVGMPGVVMSKKIRVLSSARRVDQSGVRPRAGQAKSVTRGQGALGPSSALFAMHHQQGHRPPACLPACMRLDNSLKFLESPSSVQCSVQCSVLCPSGGTPEDVPRPGVLGRVCTTSTGPMGGREPAVEGRATRLGLRREDESRMRPLQRLRRPWGRQEGNAREHKTRCAGKGLGQGLRPNHLDYATR